LGGIGKNLKSLFKNVEDVLVSSKTLLKEKRREKDKLGGRERTLL
jgi:hypothetical protein